MSTAARIGAATVALVIAAWFALGAHQSHELALATASAARGHLTSTQARHADGRLDDAAALNPDRAVDVARARVALAAGETARGRRILRHVVSGEPQDLEAWIALADVLPENSHARQLALLHILSLAPVVKGVG